jgi:hypothetical protein
MKNPKTMFTAVLLGCLGVLFVPETRALTPAPDGGYPGGNTAEGSSALFSLTSGTFNTAVGFLSLGSNTDSSFNTAIGAGALLANTADSNTAIGAGALFSNTIGEQSVANGAFALFSNTTGTSNTAIGYAALNENTTGNFNVALGNSAGLLASGSNNVYIGTGMMGVPGESNACYIASIFGQTSIAGVPVLINSDNKLGTTISSKRFKEDIKPMDKASEVLLALEPVTFRYKSEIDPHGISQFGLVAEDVEKVNPDLVVRDKKGKPYTVRYDQVNAMLLNEFLKEYRKVEQLEATVAKQRNDFETTIAELKEELGAIVARSKRQDEEIQKVKAQVGVNGAGSKVVANKP